MKKLLRRIFSKRRLVKIGHSNAQKAEVLEGLKPGETVIRHPANQIEEGARVKAEWFWGCQKSVAHPYYANFTVA